MDIVQANAPPLVSEVPGEAPPPYTTLPRSPTEASAAPSWMSPSVPLGVGYAPTGLKLGYTDFVPRLLRKRMFKVDEYETFDTLVQRANNWLEEHRAITVVSCETVTWSGLKNNIFSDSTVYTRSNNATQKTYYIRGLRLWYFASAFPDPQSPPGSAIQCRTFLPRRNERFDQLLNRANEALATDQLAGRILTVETVKFRVPPQNNGYSQSMVNPNSTYWRQRPDSVKLFIYGLRVFGCLDVGIEHPEKIGYKDFVPEHNRRNQENKGYEVFYDMMQRSTQWVARQQGVRFISIQTLDVKIKKNGPFEERCLFTEHMCARNRSNFLKGSNKKTKYIRVARIFYTMRVATLREEFPPTRLTYRTFQPLQMTEATRNSPAAYESMRQVLDRISQWLQITGAKAFSFETVPVRQSPHLGLQSLGAEATFSQTSPRGPMVEKWIYHIRVYLDGEYMEPPGAVSLVVPICQPVY